MKKYTNKIICIMGIIMIATLFSSCKSQSTKSTLQVVTNATKKQSEKIEEILESISISYQSIIVSDNPVTQDIGAEWEAYDLIDKEDIDYTMILRKSDKDFVAILDSNDEILYGIIDNYVLPEFDWQVNESYLLDHLEPLPIT